MQQQSRAGKHVTVQKRTSIPQPLEDPEDFTVGEEYYETKNPPVSEMEDKATLKHGIALLPRELRNMLAGGIAGMVAKSFVAPLDRIKILYQVSNARFHLWKIPVVAGNIIRTEGFSALWKGNTATMLRIFPYSGIQFMVFDRIKTHYLSKRESEEIAAFNSNGNNNGNGNKRSHGLTPLESLTGGMVAGAVSVIFTYPLDLSRAQLAVLKQHRNDGIKNQGLFSILAENYRLRGFGGGLFRGITPTLLGILPYSGIAFTLNEQTKRKVQDMMDREATTVERLLCGAFSGLIAQSITYPIEVTRRRMQTVGVISSDTALSSLGIAAGATAASQAHQGPPTMMHIIRSLYAEQGMMGFFKGVSVNWVKGPISFAISFTTFDTVQALMETEQERARRRHLTLGPRDK